MATEKQGSVTIQSFRVEAVWDEEAGVFISESDIIGLHIEAETLDKFAQLVSEFAPDLILANHVLADEPSAEKSPPNFYIPVVCPTPTIHPQAVSA